MKIKNIKYISYLTTTLYPAISYAAFDGLKAYLSAFGGMLNQVIRILFGLSLVYFFWGVSQFILHAGEEKTRQEGKKKIMWGIIAIFVFVSIFGIIRFIGDTLGIRPDTYPGSVTTTPGPIPPSTLP